MSWAELMDRCRNVLDTHPNRAFIAELDRMTNFDKVSYFTSMHEE